MRTGLLSELPSAVGDKLRNIIRIPSHVGQGVLAAGVRLANGEWTVSFPSEFILSSTNYSLQEAFDEIAVRLSTRVADRQPGLPDVFLFLVGKPGLNTLDIEDLKSLVRNKTLGVNSLSYVVLNQTKNYGPIYYIHTVDAMRAVDTTVFKDQLLQRFDRHQARESRARFGTEYDPFSIRP